MHASFLLLAIIGAAVSSSGGDPDGGPGPGDDAPGFSLKGSDGRVHGLADFKGKKAVVLAWFPKPFTGG